MHTEMTLANAVPALAQFKDFATASQEKALRTLEALRMLEALRTLNELAVSA